jgi:chorismate synthase
MNSIGQLFKLDIYGESHGPCVGVILSGCPAGLSLHEHDFETDMNRRKGGMQKGTTPRKEEDIPVFKSGIFNGKTTGFPICIEFANNNTRSEDYQKQRDIPRPGHADFVAHHKFGGFEDYRGGGHFSARLTTGIVAAGVIAKKVLSTMKINANILEIGGCSNLEEGLEKAIAAKDSVGGIIECSAVGLPIGLGEPYFNSIESVLSHYLFSIPAVKGVEFGAGFKAARMFGSEHNDSIINASGATSTNNAGGIVGGITNGNELVFRIAIKPTSSTPKTQTSLNWTTQEQEDFSVKGRHDLCVALRAPVIVEAVTAIALVDFMMLAQQKGRVNN